VGAGSLPFVVAVSAALILSGCGAKKLAKQGESLLAEGRTTHASRCYAKACEKRPSKASFQLGYAQALLADGQADKAVGPARRAYADEEDGSQLVLIDALVSTGQVDEARELLDRALAALPDDPETLELGARERLVRGQPRQAVVAMKKVVELEPTGPRIAYLAWLLARAGEMPRAVEAAERAFATETSDLEALGDIAAVFLVADRDPQRKDTVREIQSYGAEVLEQWTERAGRSQQVGDQEGALRAMTIAVAMRPGDGELLGVLGQMLLAMGEYARAIQFLERSMLTDGYRVAWERAQSFNEANAVLTMGFEDEAAASFCLALAQAYKASGHLSQSASAMRSSLLIGGDDSAERWLEVADLFAKARDPRGALHAAHHAYEKHPRHPGTLVALMDLYIMTGDPHQAIGYGRMAWKLVPGDPHIALTLGELFERRGDPRGARELYVVAVREHPEVGLLRNALDRVSN